MESFAVSVFVSNSQLWQELEIVLNNALSTWGTPRGRRVSPDSSIGDFYYLAGGTTIQLKGGRNAFSLKEKAIKEMLETRIKNNSTLQNSAQVIGVKFDHNPPSLWEIMEEDNRQLREENQQLREENQQLRERVQHLESRVQHLESRVQYLESRLATLLPL